MSSTQNYPTTQYSGDERRDKDLQECMASLQYDIEDPLHLPHRVLHPVLFKKKSVQTSSKSLDVRLAVDALHHLYSHNIDTIFLLTGDGDFFPILEKAKSLGKLAYLGAFSSGLNNELKLQADLFIPLDEIFFKPMSSVN